MDDPDHRSLCVRMDYGVDVVKWLQSIFFREDDEAEAVSLHGGNTLGGPVGQPIKWMEWSFDVLLSEAAPPLDMTGAKFATDWKRRKENKFNTLFTDAIVSVIAFNPLTRALSLWYGEQMHSSRRFWWGATVISALVPIGFNYYFARKTGAWREVNPDYDQDVSE